MSIFYTGYLILDSSFRRAHEGLRTTRIPTDPNGYAVISKTFFTYRKVIRFTMEFYCCLSQLLSYETPSYAITWVIRCFEIL